MANSLIDTADVVPAPKAGTDRFAFTIGTTAQLAVLFDSWKGRRVSITVSGGNVAFLTGGSDVVASYSTDSTVHASTKVITTGATVAPPILDGSSKDYFIEKDAAVTHFSIHGSTSGIRVWITPSDLADASPTHSHTD